MKRKIYHLTLSTRSQRMHGKHEKGAKCRKKKKKLYTARAVAAKEKNKIRTYTCNGLKRRAKKSIDSTKFQPTFFSPFSNVIYNKCLKFIASNFSQTNRNRFNVCSVCFFPPAATYPGHVSNLTHVIHV